MGERTLGQLIKEGRAISGHSQTEYASMLGVSQQAFGQWESDSSLPRAARYSDLVTLLGLPSDVVNRARLATMNKLGKLDLDRIPTKVKTEKMPSDERKVRAGFSLMREISQALEKNELDYDQIEWLRATVKGLSPLF